MSKNKTQLVTHTFGGGWATDLGSTHFGSPQGGQLSIPWLSQCENVEFSFTGFPQRFSGTRPLTSSAASPLVVDYAGNTFIRNVYDYWRMGATLTGTQKIVMTGGTQIFSLDPITGIITKISGSALFSAINALHYSTFNDLLILANNGDGSPYSWDQTTFQVLAGTPPAFSVSIPHKGRQWACGVPAAPYRLYYSAVGNPEDWVGAGSGSIDIDPGDGDGIVGLWSWKNDLWVFKGPNKLSIHRITGSAPADFARIPFSTGISTVGQNTIFKYGDDIGFWSPRGTCHSLATTSAYGDYVQNYINYPILSWCRNINNMLLDKHSQVVTDPVNGYTVLSFRRNIDNSIYPTRMLMMDWRFLANGEQYPRISPWTFASFASLGLVVDTAGNRPTQTQIHAGGFDGRLYHLGGQTYTHENGIIGGFDGAAIPYRIQTPNLTYGPPRYTKGINDLSVAMEYADAASVLVGWGGDNQPTQSTTITQTAPPVLGTFVLDTDTLGDYPNQYQNTDELDGDFRSIQYTFSESTAYSRMAIPSFAVNLTPSGESMENS